MNLIALYESYTDTYKKAGGLTASFYLFLKFRQPKPKDGAFFLGRSKTHFSVKVFFSQ